MLSAARLPALALAFAMLIAHAGPAASQTLRCDLLWSRVTSAKSDADRQARLAEFRQACKADRRARPPAPPVDRAARAGPVSPRVQAKGRPSRAVNRVRGRAESMAFVILDRAGKGDARTLVEALRLVASSGTVEVTPGRYDADGTVITRSVSIRGISGAGSVQPVLRGAVTVGADNVVFDNLSLEGPSEGSALALTSGSLDLRNSTVWGKSRPNAYGSAPSNGLVTVTNATLTLTNDTLSSSAGETIAMNGGNVILDAVHLSNSSLIAIYAFGGIFIAKNSEFSGTTILYSLSASISILGGRLRSTSANRYLTTADRYVGIAAARGTVVRLKDDIFDGYDDATWLCIDASVSYLDIDRNRDGSGKSLQRAGRCIYQ